MSDFAVWLTHAACGLVERIHPVSDSVLRRFLAGDIQAPDFQRLFSLPNSRYIDAAACLVANLGLGV